MSNMTSSCALTASSLFTDRGSSSILHVVQMSRLFPDSKTFVDMKVSGGCPNAVQAEFDNLLERHSPRAPPREEVMQFVHRHFTLESQMEGHEPEVRGQHA